MSRGGRERQLATLYKHTDKNRYSSKIVVFNKVNNDYIEEYQIQNKDILYLSSKNLLQRWKELVYILKKEKPDIVYAWGGFEATFCLPATVFKKTRFVNGSIRHGKVLFNTKHLWRLFTLHLSRHIVANSKAGLRANFLKRGNVLYNGIDEKFIVKPDEGEKLKKREDIFKGYSGQTVLVSVANLVPFKDYETIINALGRIKSKGFNFHYFIIGDGPMRNSVKHQIDNLGLTSEIEITGNIPNVQNYLQMADIFIHSSKGEGCSNAILEAMAAGLPVIATDTGGTPEITSEKNGRLFHYRDVDRLTLALEELITDKTLRNSMGKLSYDTVINQFTIPQMVSHFYDIVLRIMR